MPNAKRVREAFYAFAQGDPGGFSVQFAVSGAREKFLAWIDKETGAMQGAAESILAVSQRWILVAIIAVYLVGMAGYRFSSG